MSKIIKPKLNPDGSPVIDFVRFNDWYFSNISDELSQWKIEHQSSDSQMPIYYAEEWRPKENEIYWYFSFDDNTAYSTNYNPEFSGLDRQRILIGNFFESEEQANNNIIKVLDNMKKYYEEKLKGGADETLHI